MQVIKSSAFGLFSIKLDESTDEASFSQLMVFARYVGSGYLTEVLLICSPLELGSSNRIFWKRFYLSFDQKIFCGIISVVTVQMEHQLF